MRRITSTLMCAELPDGVPNHLEGLSKIIGESLYVDHPDEAKYGDASMALAGLSAQVGECADLATVRDFMRNQQRTLRRNAEQQQKLIEGLESWLRWAISWTLHKNDAKGAHP